MPRASSSPDEARLVDIGLDPARAAPKRALYAKCDAVLRASSAASPGDWRTLYVPGRIEVLGKHTDYAGGRSLVCAVSHGFCARFAPRGDSVVRVFDSERAEACEIALDAPVGRYPRWSTYVAAVVRRLARDFPEARTGVDLVFGSDLPSAAGMSSSSALVVTVALALIESSGLRGVAAFNALCPGATELAGYLGAVENGRAFGVLAGDEGVGTFGGSEDHVAAVCARAGMISRYSYGPVRHEGDYAMPPGHVFVVAASGVTAVKTGAARGPYNRLSRAVTRLLEVWNARTGRSDSTLEAALHAQAEAGSTVAQWVPHAADREFSETYLTGRLSQFVEESHELVPSAARALADGDVATLGTIADRSQALAEVALLNQTQETIALQRTARELGAAAASAFGAGFGGSVWALVPAQDADTFSQQWASVYRASHPGPARRSRFCIDVPGPGAHLW